MPKYTSSNWKKKDIYLTKTSCQNSVLHFECRMSFIKKTHFLYVSFASWGIPLFQIKNFWYYLLFGLSVFLFHCYDDYTKTYIRHTFKGTKINGYYYCGGVYVLIK